MNFSEKAKVVVELVGGSKNIIDVVNCMTRCRFILKNQDLIQEEKLKKEDFVLGVNQEGEQYQVIVGPGNAAKIVTEIKNLGLVGQKKENESNSSEAEEDWKNNKKKYKKNTAASATLKKVGEIFLPMIPGFIAAGLLLGFANLIGNSAISEALNQGLTKEEAIYGPIYYFLQTMGMALYGYLVIFTGINTARVFGGTEILGGIIGGFILSPTLTPLFLTIVTSETFNMFGNQINTADFAASLPGKGGIFGVMFAVMFMSYLEKKIRKVMPGMLDLILTPLITLILAGIATVIFMIFAGFLTDIIGIVLNFLVNTNGIVSVISGALIAGFFLPLVTLGLHQGLTPIYLNEIATNGATYIFPIAAMAGAGQVGAAISIFIQAKKIKKEKIQKVISGALVPGILGVGEPLIYGVTLPLGKPFITAGLGAAIGGAYISFAHVGAIATGPSGLTALPLILPEDILQYIIGILISYIAAFTFTTLMFKYDGREV